MTPLRILVVEDSEYDVELIERELRASGYELDLEHVDTREGLEATLAPGGWDVVLCDFNLPGFSALEALEVVTASEIDAPFIVLSGTIGEEAAVEALKAGARDVVLKSNLPRLIPVLERALKEAEARREREQIEQNLRATNELLRALLDSSPLAIAATDPERITTLWNATAERMFGWKKEEVLGGPLPIVPPGEKHELDLVLENGGSDEAVVDFETKRMRKDGTLLDVSLSLAPLRDTDGNLTGLVGVLADITERKRAREELQRSIELLRAANEGRRRLLERLVRAEEEERQRIAADVHDDSVQALTALALRLGVASLRTSDQEAASLLSEAERTTQGAIERLRRLMFELRPPALDRDGLVETMRLYLDQARTEHGFEYALDAQLEEEPPPETRAVAYRIAQEALVNVIKHARARRVEVGLATRAGGIWVRVEDDGIGFSPESARDQIGHVGLDSMRERAELAGGWWKVRSAEDKGTTVEFFLPTAAATIG